MITHVRPHLVPAVLAIVGACAACGPAVETGPSPAAGSPRLAVLSQENATAVGFALTLSGSHWETDATAGLTLLTVRTLLEQARPALDALGARADVACDRAVFTIRVVAPAAEWRTAAGVVTDVLARADPGEAALSRARTALARALTLDQANPAWQARLVARQALYGTGDAWGAPACGVPETLPLFTLQDILRAAGRLAGGPVTAAVVGTPNGSGARAYAERLLAPFTPGPSTPATAFPGRSVEPVPPDSVWYAERNTITAWTSISFPFGAGTDPESTRLLGAVLVDMVSPALSRTGVFDAGYELDRHGNGGALIIHVVTAPAVAADYAATVADAVRSIAEDGVHPAVYDRVLRKHRGRRLLELEAPESRAAAAARALAFDRAPVHWPDPGDAGSTGIRAAAASLGPAVRSLVGPRSARSVPRLDWRQGGAYFIGLPRFTELRGTAT